MFFYEVSTWTAGAMDQRFSPAALVLSPAKNSWIFLICLLLFLFLFLFCFVLFFALLIFGDYSCFIHFRVPRRMKRREYECLFSGLGIDISSSLPI